MTNDELTPNDKMTKGRRCGRLSFGLRHSFVIRHPPFVIVAFAGQAETARRPVLCHFFLE
jgi:hypothetical protein